MITISVVAAAASAMLAQQDTWQRYAPPDSAFAIVVPGTPRESTMFTETRGGPLATQMVSVDDPGNSSFAVSWTDYAGRAQPRGTDSLVTRMVDALARSRDARTVHAGAPGAYDAKRRAALLRTEDGRQIQVRFFFAGTRVYQVVAETRDDDASLARANRFMDSFELRKG